MSKVQYFLDNCIVLSFCQRTGVELYSEMTHKFIESIMEEKSEIMISESVHNEFLALKEKRFETLISNIRILWQNFKPDKSGTPLILQLEDLAFEIRENIENALIFDLIELHIHYNIEKENTDSFDLKAILYQMLMRIIAISGEIDKLYRQLLKTAKNYPNFNKIDISKFQHIGIKGKDKEHLSIAHHYAAANKSLSIFVTVDNGILSKASEIRKQYPQTLRISTPLYALERAKYTKNT